jgi:hypothetical protein
MICKSAVDALVSFHRDEFCVEKLTEKQEVSIASVQCFWEIDIYT